MQEYAEKIVSFIDPDGHIENILSRDHCIMVNKMFIKNLKLLNRELNKVILIDNNPNSCLLQPDNLLLIKSFEGDEEDK